MNTTKLKAYAPVARREFIKAVTSKAHMLGLSDEEILPVDLREDVVIIGGQAFPKKIAEQRKQLEERIRKDGFDNVMRAMAYTWFNRFVAIRFMELHDYLDHGFWVLSNPGGSDVPEILEQAAHVELLGLNQDEVVKLRLAGEKDEELYRLLLLAQCSALNKSMPFLFESIGGGTELLLPDNLLHSGSAIRTLVDIIPEEDWQNVEIIGWLYQFYISEKKDEVIGKVVKSEDIPAATQLFTPNWIVKYMVQNSLGRKWMMTYPESHLKEKMEFYIEPAEQDPEVQQQLDDITPSELNPEEITLLDPACGSGHILVEAYDLFKEIYQERGYRVREIPKLILEKNLYGLDIDDRAAQLTGFCLLMKAREDDRRILTNDDLKMNVLAIQESKGIDPDNVAKTLNVDRGDVAELLELFEYGKTFGSLIQVPENLAERLDVLRQVVDKGIEGRVSQGVTGQLQAITAETLQPIVDQAEVLAKTYDCVVANPPYMGRKGMTGDVKKFANTFYPGSDSDLYTMFITKNYSLAKKDAFISMITMDSWMYGDDYNIFREAFANKLTVIALAHLGSHAFDEISGEVVQTATFSLRKRSDKKYIGSYYRLVEPTSSTEKMEFLLRRRNEFLTSIECFDAFPRLIFAYYADDTIREIFKTGFPLKDIAEAYTGLQTGDNERFIRQWYEVNNSRIFFNSIDQDNAIGSGARWFPYVKGSDYRKWYGNQTCILNWENDGFDIRNHRSSRPQNSEYYFKSGLAYNNISKNFCARFVNNGFIFDQKNSMLVGRDIDDALFTLRFLHSKVVSPLLTILSPKDFNPGSLKIIPVASRAYTQLTENALIKELIEIAKLDWDSFEKSWDFQLFPLVSARSEAGTIQQSFHNWRKHCETQIKRMQELETENNRLFIDAYGLQDELKPEVPEDQITLARADQLEDIKRLLSYSIGCMMGRYCLDESGLIYAHSGNEGFDQSRYKSLPADDDGIIPIMDMDWFDDDASNRFTEFLKVTWGTETLTENLQFIAETLKQKKNENPEDTIRRYFSTTFFKDHLKTYKKRPIYWLFSSGKQKAFTCLVYLHRYNESTLPRMRSAYVTPLQGKFNARLDYLQSEINQATTASAKKKLQKELDIIKKKQTELAKFDEELRHYADKRIHLDLDEGVKVNYGKFGALLAEKKAVTGKK